MNMKRFECDQCSAKFSQKGNMQFVFGGVALCFLQASIRRGVFDTDCENGVLFVRVALNCVSSDDTRPLCSKWKGAQLRLPAKGQ